MLYAKLPKIRQQEILGEVIKELLTANGLSYRDFAPRMAWSHGQLGHIVTGRRNLDFLDWIALASSLEIPPSDFLSRLEDKSN